MEIGTPHPTRAVSIDPRARWVVLEQAREDTNGDRLVRVVVTSHDERGDRFATYLFVGEGRGERIDELVGRDEDGDHIVFIQRRRIVMMHVESGRRWELGWAPRSNRSEDAIPTLVSFDRDGRRMAYTRWSGGRTEVRVRELDSGREVRIATGGRRVAYAELDRGGAFVQLALYRPDRRPALLRALREIPELHFDFIRHTRRPSPNEEWAPDVGWRDGRLVHAIAVLPELRARPVSQLVAGEMLAVFGEALLTRADDGALWLESPGGASEVLVPAECAPRVLRSSPRHQRVIVECMREGAQSSVELFSPTEHVRLEPASSTGYAVYLSSDRAYPRDGALVDVPPAIAALEDGRVRLRRRGAALVQRGSCLLWLDFSSGRTRSLGMAPASHERARVVGDYAFLGEMTIDLARGVRTGEGQPRAIGFDARGRRLVPLRGWELPYPRGPFVWFGSGDRPLRSPDRRNLFH